MYIVLGGPLRDTEMENPESIELFFVAIFLCCSSTPCRDREFTSFMFFFVATEIIFFATEILLLLVVNSKCYVQA